MTDKTCGYCIYGRGEECDGPSGSREGREIYSDPPACDCYEEDDTPAHEIFPGTLDALHKLGVANTELCGWPSGPSERAPGYASAAKTEE
jgi:hypothetical protein